MRIDRTHRPWAIATAVIFGVALIAYIPYAASNRGASGGSVVGIIYGSAGFGCMIFAALLGFRKKFPIWRMGRAQSWMRGHLWLGLLSLPLILFHGGFHFGGLLTTVLMWLLIASVVSGILGALLQHYMPRVLTQQLPTETIYQQIDRVRDQLLSEADHIANDIKKTALSTEARAAAKVGGTVLLVDVPKLDVEEFQSFYIMQVRAFLEAGGHTGLRLASPERAAAAFSHVKTSLPEDCYPQVTALQEICDEKRGLDRQRILHRLLHGWLLLHIPASLAVVVLGFVHAVGALRY